MGQKKYVFYLFFLTDIIARVYISIKYPRPSISHTCCDNQKVGLGKKGRTLIGPLGYLIRQHPLLELPCPVSSSDFPIARTFLLSPRGDPFKSTEKLATMYG